MRVIIAGAGRVGLAVASVITRDGSALMMETDAQRAEAAQNMKGISVLRNDASNPQELRAAIERFNPDAVVAAVNKDSINIFICSVVKHFRPQIKTIATIRESDYVVEGGNAGVDEMIAPRAIAADRIAMCSMIENAISFSRITSLGLCTAVFRVDRGQKIAGRHVLDLECDDGAVVAIYRGGDVLLDTYSEQIHTDDRLLVIGTEDMVRRFNESVGIQRTARNITIIGASDLGIRTADILLNSPGRHAVKVIDDDLARCNKAARVLRGAIVVHGAIHDPMFLRSENVDRADAVLALSEAEDMNLLICMNAERFGVRKILSQYNGQDYGDLLRYSGIEGALGYYSVIVNETSVKVANTISADNSFVFDTPQEGLFALYVDNSLRFFNKLVGDIYLPDSMRIVAVMRDGKVFLPTLTTRIVSGDRVMFYSSNLDKNLISRTLGRPFLGM